MTRTYDVDIALSVGGVPEAVVLGEVAFWCRKNEEAGKNLHDGRYWSYRSLREWQSTVPEFKGRVIGILKRLEVAGWIISGNFNNTPFDRTKWYALSDKSISLFAQIDLPESQNGFDDSGRPIPENKTSSKDSIEEILKKNAEVIDRLYALYPGKSETRDGMRSTGKCSKDKHRLAGLLRTHTPEQIERSIKMYLEEQGGKYLKNFSTFLNNLPEYEEDTAPTPTREDRARALGYQTWNG